MSISACGILSEVNIYTRFNIDRPEDFTGRSLSVSDVIVVHQEGQDIAYYCDSFGFTFSRRKTI